jgi:hypothetical protein
MIFFKFYDTVRELMYYIGNFPVKNGILPSEHLTELKRCVDVFSKRRISWVYNIIILFFRKAGLPQECAVKFYEEATSALISETAVSDHLSDVELVTVFIWNTLKIF